MVSNTYSSTYLECPKKCLRIYFCDLLWYSVFSWLFSTKSLPSSRNDHSARVIATIPSSYYSHRSLEAATVNGGQMSHFSPDVHRNGIGGGHGGSFGGRRRRGRWLRRRNRRSRTRGRRNSAGVVISSSRLPALEDQNTLLVLTNFAILRDLALFVCLFQG